MSRFTFAKGNAQKVVSLPVYALGALVSLVIPRARREWAIGCGSGVGEGALALTRFALAQEHPVRVTWLARNARDTADCAALGITSVPLASWRGFWRTLRAEVLVVTHGFGDVNRFGTRGGFIVQLWHGIPLKLVHLDSPATLRSPILPNSRAIAGVLRWLYRGAARAIRLMPAASELAATRLRSAFALDTNTVLVTGDPRDDVLCVGEPEQRRALSRQRLDALLPIAAFGDAPLVLHAPTWRDGDVDPSVPTDAQWLSIADHLRSSGSILIVRPHHLGVGDWARGAEISERVLLLGADLASDITPLLPAIDVLITDYSSIAFDYALTGGPILYLAPDVADYTASRGLYEPFERFSAGRAVGSWGELLEQLTSLSVDPAARAAAEAHSAALAQTHHAFRDGRNTERVYREIVSRTERAR